MFFPGHMHTSDLSGRVRYGLDGSVHGAQPRTTLPTLVQRTALYYLRHTRTTAAVANGCRTIGGKTSLSSGGLDGVRVYVAAAAFFLRAWWQAALLCVAAGCLQACANLFGCSLSWNICMALLSGMPLQTFAAIKAWDGSALAQVVVLLVLAGFHVAPRHCKWLSVLCALAMPGSAGL